MQCINNDILRNTYLVTLFTGSNHFMARPGVTYSEIAEAATHLVGQGKNPTIEQIRLLLGTGSSTTIANHLKQWRDEQQGTSLLAAKENIPNELMEMVKGLWERVIGLSQEKMNAAEADFNKRLDEATLEIQKYKTNNHKWQKLFGEWQRDKAMLAVETDNLKNSVETLQDSNTALRQQLSAQEAALKEKQARIDELHQLHQQTQMNLEHYRESVRLQRLMDTEKHDKEVQALSTTLKSAENKLAQTTQEKILLQQQYEKLHSDNIALTKSIDDMQNKNQTLQQANIKLEKQLHAVEHTSNHLQQQSDKLQRQLDLQTKDLIEEKARCAVMKGQVARLEKRMKNKAEVGVAG